MQYAEEKMNFNKAEFTTSYGISSQLPKSDVVEVAFAGRSNVGKSSLINKVLNRKSLARVSSMPGKTITINYYKVDTINFVDLPGYGYAKSSKSEIARWSKLIEDYFRDNDNLRLVVSLIDMRHPPTKLDIDMINFLIDAGYPFIVVLTKADKLNKGETKKRLELIRSELPCGEDIKIIPCSSSNGQGMDELKEIITDVSM